MDRVISRNVEIHGEKGKELSRGYLTQYFGKIPNYHPSLHGYLSSYNHHINQGTLSMDLRVRN